MYIASFIHVYKISFFPRTNDSYAVASSIYFFLEKKNDLIILSSAYA